ncbi:MAG: hypothetical protein WCI48_09770 [Bacteroidota bacterium]|jgi:hypothetical protein
MINKIVTRLIRFSFLLLFIAIAAKTYSDPPPPPGNPSGGGGGGGPVGAPIDGGLGILLSMGVVYGGRKYYQARKMQTKAVKNEEEAL